MFIPDGDVDLNQWKSQHADHFATNQHVSQSKFREFHGSIDLGTRLHIEPAGSRRDADNKKIEAVAQRKRCQSIKGA